MNSLPKKQVKPKEFYYLKHKAAFLRQNNIKLPAKDVRKILYERLLSLNAEEKAVFEEEYLKYSEEYRLKWEKFM